MAKELGLVTAILIGLALGYAVNLVLTFWVTLLWRGFPHTKWYWKWFFVSMVAWVIAMCTISMDFFEKASDAWGKQFIIFIIGSIFIMAIYGNIKEK